MKVQRFNRTGSTQKRPRHGWPKKLIAHAQRPVKRLCFGKRGMSAASIAAEVEGLGVSLSCSDHMPHTASNWSAWLSSQKKASFKDDAQESPQTVWWRQADLDMDMDYWNHVLWSKWDQDKLIWFRWCQAWVAATRWGVQRQVCLAYSQAWWLECHVLGLHECCQHWGATVHWGNHECQHVLWHTEAGHDPPLSETGPQGSVPTW